MKHTILSVLILFAFTGCERTRSFMQMDSNSGSPFMGLQLSVDAKQPMENDLVVATETGRKDVVQIKKTAAPITSVSGRNRTPGYVATASSRSDVGNLKFALPKADLSNSPEAAAEVEEILTRI